MSSVHPRRLRCDFFAWLVGTLLSVGALADELKDVREVSWEALPDYTGEIDSGSFESIKYGKHLKVKGWRLSEGVYFGGVKIGGEYGPGVVFDEDSYVWGFNHERIQIQLRF